MVSRYDLLEYGLNKFYDGFAWANSLPMTGVTQMLVYNSDDNNDIMIISIILIMALLV